MSIRLTLFDAAAGGAAQSEPVVIENAQAVNGIFTIYPNFYSALTNNNQGKFLEIVVRPGAASGA